MKKSLLFLMAGITLLNVSCSKSQNGVAFYKSSVPEMAMEEALFDDSLAVASSKKVMARAQKSAVNGVSELYVPTEYETERKLIKTGYVNLQIESLDSFDVMVQNFAKKYGGYITNTHMSENNFSAEVKVPCSNFEAAMNNAGELGKIKSRSQNANDVTDEYYDLESRLNSKKILKEKLEGYLSKAESIKDLMEIENQLNIVVSDLESMEGRMQRLSKQIDYSTISINAYLPVGQIQTGFDWPDLKENFREFGVNVVNFFANLLVFILYLVIYGIPVIGIVAFLFWLLFGKIGLLVKLYKLIKRK